MIPVIVKGQGVSGALRYVLSEGHEEQKEESVTYALMRANGQTPTKTYRQLAANDTSRAEILGGQNFGFEVHDAKTMDLARRMMEWNGHPDNQASKTRKCEVDCFHAMLNWEPGETPDKAEMLAAAGSFMKAVGMEGAQAVFVAHHDKAHSHVHIVASRIDPATGKTLSQKDDWTISQAWGVEWDRQHGIVRDTPTHSLAAMVATRDHTGLLDHFTKDRPTFIDPTVTRALRFGGLDDEQRTAFRAELMAHPSLVALRDQAGGDVTRYTTRDILKSEMRVMGDAGRLHDDRSHGIDGRQLDRIAEAFAFTLKPEQNAAVHHLTGSAGLSILWGEAGTGKSYTLKAARVAYEQQGCRVIGMSHTNKVVQDMRANGFEHYDTVARQLNALRKGREVWDSNTVLMIDEAAMLATKQLGQILDHAARAGAKVILAGDDAQLASIEPGGIFGRLRREFGAATLQEVQRVGHDADQQRAFGAMHDGDFKTALEIFDGKGFINWTEKQDQAAARMAVDYAAAVADDPSKSRFLFAFKNTDVAMLNEAARALHKARGDLGDDVTVETAYGPQAYAPGDRIQFSGNAWQQADRERGLVNGRVGTVESVELDGAGRAHMTVALDAGREAQRVSFVVGEDARGGEFDKLKRGYAGTIYKGQGATLDETFVLADASWRDSGAYVALSRHRESTHLYSSRQVFDDLADMARSFGRSDGTDAAMSYVIDDAVLLELGAELVAEKIGARADQAADLDQAAQPPQVQEQASTSGQVAAVAEAVLDSIADNTAKVIDTLADTLEGLLGGSPSKPAPKRAAEPEPMTAEERHKARIAAFLAEERAEREARLREIAHSLGADESLSAEDLERERKRQRDRGGQSL